MANSVSPALDLAAAFVLGAAAMFLLLAWAFRRAAQSWSRAEAEWRQAHARAEEAKNISAHNVQLFEQYKLMIERNGFAEFPRQIN